MTGRGERNERGRLGDALAEAAAIPEQARRAASKPLRATLLLTIVHRPVLNHPKAPEWEQLAATAGMVTTLSPLLHGHGFASIWRTGGAVQAPRSANTSASTTTNSSWAGCTSARGRRMRPSKCAYRHPRQGDLVSGG